MMAEDIGRGLTPEKKWLLGWGAAVAIAIPLALGMTGASKAATRGAVASGRRLPSFETASIKPDKLQTPLLAGRLLPGMPLAGVNLRGGNLTATTIVAAMIMDAYGESSMRPLSPAQVLGGPAWIRTDFYEVNAKVSDSIVNGEWKKLSIPQQANETMLMFRSLLIDRFRLRVRHETKVLPVLELTLAKNGPRITEDKTDGQSCRMTGIDTGLGLDVKSCDLSDFVGILSVTRGARGRTLVDKTGLHGRYTFKLHWTPEMPPEMPKPASAGQLDQSAAPPESSDSPFLTALPEQLGLNLVPAEGPVDVIVIEHIERPIEN